MAGESEIVLFQAMVYMYTLKVMKGMYGIGSRHYSSKIQDNGQLGSRILVIFNQP